MMFPRNIHSITPFPKRGFLLKPRSLKITQLIKTRNSTSLSRDSASAGVQPEAVTRPFASLKTIFPRKEAPQAIPEPILKNNNLFHPLSRSPIAAIKERAKLINNHGTCSTCVEHLKKEDQKRPIYECPDCGYPTHCSPQHYKQDLEKHKKICSGLREANEDEHDLRSGREIKEFVFPTEQDYDYRVNMLNWDTFFYTRSFPSLDEARSMRHVSKALTYPITIASVLHESGPYTLRNRLTSEGLKSQIALKHTIYSIQETTQDLQSARPFDVIRVLILGARAEAQLPPEVYQQISYLFPNTTFHIHFIGPQALPPKEKLPLTKHFNTNLSFTWTDKYYTDYHDTLKPFDPYTDVFFLFSPGFGQLNGKEFWGKTIKRILGTKCAIFITGYDEQDMETDVRALEEGGWMKSKENEPEEENVKVDMNMDDNNSEENHKDEFDWLLEPGENPFRSLKRDVNIQDVREHIFANWGIFGIRGKKYEVKSYEEEEEQVWIGEEEVEEEEEMKQLKNLKV